MQRNTDIRDNILSLNNDYYREITPVISQEEFSNKIKVLNDTNKHDYVGFMIYKGEMQRNFAFTTYDVFENRQSYIDYLNEKYGYNYIELPLSDSTKWADRFFEDANQKTIICFSAFSPLHKKFYNLHINIVNQIINFCKENNVQADNLHLSADCLNESIEYGKWCPYTDSSFSLYNNDEETILWSI